MSGQVSTSQSPLFSRRLDRIDRVLSEAGRAMQVLSGAARAARPNPAGKPDIVREDMSPRDRNHAAALMRVNHVGEVCAQALYRGQAAFCGDAQTQRVLENAASEEIDHLVWCRDRIDELQGRPSYLNPLWYAGSFTLGLLAGGAGSARNLGFMAETESQVEQHLNRHLSRLPAADHRSRRIVEQMRDDEARHRTTAQSHGAEYLAWPVRVAMRAMAKLMTTTAYRV